MQFTTVQLKINFKFHSLTTCIKRKIRGSLPFTSPSKEVSTELGKPPNRRYVFPNCLNDSFPFSHRTYRTSTLKTGNIHLGKRLLNVTRLKLQRWPPWCAPEPLQAAQYGLAARLGTRVTTSQVAPNRPMQAQNDQLAFLIHFTHTGWLDNPRSFLNS